MKASAQPNQKLYAHLLKVFTPNNAARKNGVLSNSLYQLVIKFTDEYAPDPRKNTNMSAIFHSQDSFDDYAEYWDRYIEKYVANLQSKDAAKSQSMAEIFQSKDRESQISTLLECALPTDLTQRCHSEFYAAAQQKGSAEKTEFWDVVIMASPPEIQALRRDLAIATIRQNPSLLTDEQWRNLPVFAQEKVAYDDNIRMKQLLGIAPKVVDLMDLLKLQSYAEREGRQEQQASTHQHLAVLLTANILPNTDFFRKLSFDLDQLSTVFKDHRKIKDKWKAAVLAGMNCAEPERKAHEDLVPSAVFTWGKDEDIITIGRKFESLITRSRSKEEAEKNYRDFQRYQTSIEDKWKSQQYQYLNIIRKALQTAQERFIQSLQKGVGEEKQAEYAEDIENLTVILREQAENIVRDESANLKTATKDDKLLCEANKKSAESFRDNVAKTKIKFYRRKYQAIADQREEFQKAASQIAVCYDEIAKIQEDDKEQAKYRLAAKVARTKLNTGNLQSQESGITLADALKRRDADDSYGCLSSYCVKSKDTFTMQHAFDGSPIDALGDPKKEMDLFISDAESVHDIFILLQEDDTQCTMYCDYLIARHSNDSNSEFAQAIKDVLNQRAEQQLKQAVKTAYATCCDATEEVHEKKSVQLVHSISENHFSNLGCDLQQSHDQLQAKLRKIKEAVSFIKAMKQPEACHQPHDEIDNAVKKFFQT